MSRRWWCGVIALTLLLAGCATGDQAAIRVQSLQTLEQASQHGSRG